MAKGAKGKSSASSGTRKKQAAKAAAKAGGEPPVPKQQQRGQKKDKKDKKAPKKKQYIPPPKPPQPPPDPLDSMGIAALLPAQLTVTLRKAGKKDVITRVRALEQLLAWIEGRDGDEEGSEVLGEEEREAALVTMLPVWAHLFPRLSVSPTRRLRLLTATIQARLVSATRASTRFELLTASQYVETILGPWAVLAWDTDRATGRIARESWDGAVRWDAPEAEAQGAESETPGNIPGVDFLDAREHLSNLLAHLSALLLFAPASSSQAHIERHGKSEMERERDAKNRDDTNVEEDAAAVEKRLAAGALGVLQQIISIRPEALLADEVEPLLSSLTLWSALLPSSSTAGNTASDAIGENAPNARARAWTLLRTLLTSWPEMLERVLPIVAPIALASAWEERDVGVQRAMLDGLLPLLKAHPKAWTMSSANEVDDEDSDDDSSDENEDEGDATPPGTDEEASAAVQHLAVDTTSSAYVGFQKWIQNACGGTPTLGYPAAIVLISTLPAEILPAQRLACSSLLDSLYVALDTRALDSDIAGARSFLSSFCETVAFLAARIARHGEEEDRISAAGQLVDEQLGKVWNELVLGLPPSGLEDSSSDARLRRQRIRTMGDARIASELGSTLRKIGGLTEDAAAVDPHWARVSSTLVSLARTASLPESAKGSATEVTAVISRITLVLSNVTSQATSAVSERVHSLVLESAREAAAALLEASTSATAASEEHSKKVASLNTLLAGLVRAFSSALSQDAETRASLDKVAGTALPALTAAATISPQVSGSFLSAYLPICPEAPARQRIWIEVLGSVVRLPSSELQVDALIELFTAADATSVEELTDAELSSSGIDEVALKLMAEICEGPSGAKKWQAIGRLLDKPKPFIEASSVEELLVLLVSRLEHRSRHVISAPSASSANPDGPVLAALLEVLHAWLAGLPARRTETLIKMDAFNAAVPAVFELAHVLPHIASGSPEWSLTTAAANRVWKVLANSSQAETEIVPLVAARLQSRLIETSVPIKALVAAAQALTTLPGLSSYSVVSAVIPAPGEFDKMFLKAAVGQPKITLSLIDPLVPQSEVEERSVSPSDQVYDLFGLTSFARCVSALIYIFESDRSLARLNTWVLPHLILLAILAEDQRVQPESSATAFSPSTSEETLAELAQSAVRIATSILSSLAGELPNGWHANTVSALQKGQAPQDSNDLAAVLAKVYAQALEHDLADVARTFSKLLSGVLNFSSAEASDGERWLKLGQSIQDKATIVAQAITYDVKGLVLETPTYDRYRNELAARLAGVPPSKANTSGLPLLRLLIAAAPPSDSTIVFLPQQRAIFLLQALQKWVASDEDLDEEINTRLVEIFVHLAPIVQEITGSHTDFFFDLVESNLEIAALSDDSTFPALYNTLRLLEVLRDLALRNATLREVWRDRKTASLELVHNLFISQAETPRQSAPHDMISEMLVELVHEVPAASFKSKDDLKALSTLVSSQSHDVQVVSYRLLSASVREHVRELVVEAAVDKEGAGGEIKLAEELISIIKTSFEPSAAALAEDSSVRRSCFGFLLSWLVAFDHFEDASLQLKSAYLAHLQQLDLAASSLLPSVFEIIGLLRHQRFDPNRWAIDEVFLDEIDTDSVSSLQVLASHVYYRALIHIPTLVRSWWLDTKDRQLSMSVSSFTTRSCSPLIAERELAHLREPEALSQLRDEAMAIRVLANNEVVATYTVDEHPMEIGVRIPPDFPLHSVEIRDIRRVGVSEAQWRAWILAVQQLITSQNGLILDALTLFKKNAEARFQGFEGAECAICYSIISPTDRTLPTKPCKTCKNRFHSSCLYKWVSTSGSSTCPLCRSIL